MRQLKNKHHNINKWCYNQFVNFIYFLNDAIEYHNYKIMHSKYCDKNIYTYKNKTANGKDVENHSNVQTKEHTIQWN